MVVFGSAARFGIRRLLVFQSGTANCSGTQSFIKSDVERIWLFDQLWILSRPYFARFQFVEWIPKPKAPIVPVRRSLLFLNFNLDTLSSVSILFEPRFCRGFRVCLVVRISSKLDSISWFLIEWILGLRLVCRLLTRWCFPVERTQGSLDVQKVCSNIGFLSSCRLKNTVLRLLDWIRITAL